MNPPVFGEHVQDLPDVRYRAGLMGKMRGTRFASGTGTFMSRDLVEIAINDPAREYNIVDDVTQGPLHSRVRRRGAAFKRMDVLTAQDLNALAANAQADVSLCVVRGLGGRYHDTAAMHRVLELYGALVRC